MASPATVQWIGADNTSSPANLTAERANYLKLFSGEVLSSFEDNTYLLDKHVTRTIKNGKSSQFPVIGRMPDAEYHTPGTELTGQQVLQSERVITIDRLLTSHIFLDNLDEAMAHFDVRSRYAKLMGTKLALTYDNHVGRNIIKAARSTETVTGSGDDGYIIENSELASATAATKLAAWIDSMEEIAATFVLKNVPKPWYLALKPADFYFLIRNVEDSGMSLIHKDFGGEGSLATGSLPKVFDINIMPMNTLPDTDYSGETFHAIDCGTTVGMAWSEEAAATLKLLNLSSEAEWDIRRQGWLMVSKYAYGHDYLRPECAIELRTADPAV